MIGVGILSGMAVTLRNFIGSYFEKDRLITVQYPEEPVTVQPRYREYAGDILKSAAGKTVEATDEKAWLSLELLDPVEQELSMTVEQLGARGDVRHSSVLYELGYRLAVLVGAPPLEGVALPIGPHALAKAFHGAIGELHLPVAHHMMLLQHFESLVTLQTVIFI